MFELSVLLKLYSFLLLLSSEEIYAAMLSTKIDPSHQEKRHLDLTASVIDKVQTSPD